MLSWDEFDKPEETAAKTANGAAKPAAAELTGDVTLEKLDSVGDAAAHDARAARTNSAVCRRSTHTQLARQVARHRSLERVRERRVQTGRRNDLYRHGFLNR